jgi:hypothetical protein
MAPYEFEGLLIQDNSIITPGARTLPYTKRLLPQYPSLTRKYCEGKFTAAVGHALRTSAKPFFLFKT